MERDLERAAAQNILEQLSLWQAARTRFIDFLAPQQLSSALDLCCGTGAISFLLAEKVQSVVGVDSSAHCLTLARSRPSSGPVAPTFQSLELPTLPFDAHSFDLVVGSHALLEGIRLEVLAGEVWRVVRPGGTFGALIPSRRFTPATLRDWVGRNGLSPQESTALARILPDSAGTEWPEKTLEAVLLGGGWRRLRTIELLDGLLLGVKAMR